MIASYSIILLFMIASAAIGVLLVRWFVNRNQRQIAERNRGLFRFSDGGDRIRSVDPIVVLMKFESHEKFRLDLHPLRAFEGEREATEILIDAVRSAFSVPEYSSPGQSGLTAQECLDLFRAFVFYVDAQKKNFKNSRMLAAFLDAMFRRSEDSITKPTLDSGSIASEV